jgi:hypothetical protein
MPNPTRDTVAGRIYNDLRNLARRTSAPTDQVMLESGPRQSWVLPVFGSCETE